MTAIATETLGFRRTGISPALSLLVPAFSLPPPPAPLAGAPSRACGMLPYRPRLKARTRGFGTALSPATLSAPPRSTGELLRTLSRNGCFWANLLAVRAGAPHFTLGMVPGPRPAVRAVPLSTANLVARSLTPALMLAAFRVWSDPVGHDSPSPVQCFTSASHARGCPQRHFGESQLSPGLFSLSLRATGHRCPF